MPARTLLLAIDQGTTGTTVLVVSPETGTLGKATVEFPQYFPEPGWVEHDAGQIWESVERATGKALAEAGVSGGDIAAIGITNQRETTLVWDRASGAPIHRAIVWQDRRTAPACEKLRKEGQGDRIRERTGLVVDAYFSATKIAWLLDHVGGARKRAEAGELAFGTIDSYLVQRLTGGAAHLTDVTNASRTLLMNLARAEWDPEMLALFRVPRALLPRIVGSAEVVGETRGVRFLPDGIPIAGIAGDQQAALFGQGCLREGDAKCTYGTGAFALVNIGARPVFSTHGLVTTAAWKMGGSVTYALEGSAFIAGAAIQWLRDGLGIVKSADEIEALARKVTSTEGVAFVPALAGLGAPYWDPDARGLVCGITRGTTAAHLARAALEGIAFQVNDLLDAMARDSGAPLQVLKVDGGASRNDLLMQFQADVASVSAVRPKEIESTGRGAAMLAAVGAGILPLADAVRLVPVDRTFTPAIDQGERSAHLERWKSAVARARSSAARPSV